MKELMQVLNEAFTGHNFCFRMDELEMNMHRNKDLRFAIARIKKAEMSKLVNGRGTHIGQEARLTVAVRCYDIEREFKDIGTLDLLVEAAMAELLSKHRENVRWLDTGEQVKDMATGRYCMTVMIELVGYSEAEAEEENDV